MRSAAVFVVAALANVIACGSDSNVVGSRRASSLPATVNCEDAVQLRERAARDRRSSSERASDQEKIDLANRARFIATLANIADLRCRVSLADADEILRRALDAARVAQGADSFYARTFAWQEAGFIADEAVSLMIKGLPNPAAK